MPLSELCNYCKQRIDRSKDQFVIITEKTDSLPPVIAHEKCAQDNNVQKVQLIRVRGRDRFDSY